MTKPKQPDSFRFRLGKGDDDIRELLEGLPKRERSQAVKTLIRRALEERQSLEAISTKLDRVLALLPPSDPN